MFKQEIFNRVATHLLNQNAKSSVVSATAAKGYKCLYRGSNGLKCAVGALISDEHYTSELDTGAYCAWNTVVLSAVTKSFECEVEPDWLSRLLCDLQRIHDDHEVADWRLALGKLAREENLEFVDTKETNNG